MPELQVILHSEIIAEKPIEQLQIAGINCRHWPNEGVYHLSTEANLYFGDTFPAMLVKVPKGIGEKEVFDQISAWSPKDVVSEILNTCIYLICYCGQSEKEAYLYEEGQFKAVELQVIAGQEELYSRNKGLIEVDLLKHKKVCLIGLGSFGSVIAVELAKAGVQQFSLFDFDRIETSNIARHICGTADLGRLKTDAIEHHILQKNPYAEIEKFPLDINDNLKVLTREMQQADLTICITDENRSRSNINEIALELGKRCLFGRAITRAEGGDVFRLRADEEDAACLACVIGNGLFNYQQDEVSNKRQAKRDAPDYVEENDVEAVIQVGLSSDIIPICNMITKLALVELSTGMDSGLDSLTVDLEADYYLWANRRENQYKTWPSMGFKANQPSILRWYGARTIKDASCMVCGNPSLL